MMIRNIFRLLAALLAFIPSMALAQVATGQWRLHPQFGVNYGQVVETADKVYYTSNGYLYSYDKDGDETQSYTRNNKLSDSGISRVFYNDTKHYLMIVYANSNIDLLYDDGRVVNMSDLKSAVLNASKAINWVTFDGDEAYVATAFGFMVINDEKHEVKYSRIYNEDIKAVAVIDNQLLLFTATKLKWGPKDGRYNEIADFGRSMDFNGVQQVEKLPGGQLFVMTGYTYLLKCNPSTGNIEWKTLLPGGSDMSVVTESGFTIQSRDGNLINFDSEGNKLGQTALNADLKASRMASAKADGSYWVLSAKGIKHISLDASGSETVLSDYFRPDATSVSQPFNLVFNSALNKLYVMNSGGVQWADGYNKVATVNTLEGSTWTDVTPQNVPSKAGDGVLRDPLSPVFDPDDPNTYYIGSWLSGLYKISNDEVVANYFTNNSPLQIYNNWSCIVPSVQFDRDGNLWIAEAAGGTIDKPLMILPRSKQQNVDISASDWITMSVPGMNFNFKMHLMISPSTNYKLMTDGTWSSVLVVLDDNGTIDNTADDRVRQFSTMLDQDEKSYEWHYLNCLVEDANGKIWMGTSNGVVEFNPANIFNDNFRINHIKVPRNDGTSYADYLLANTNVLCIAVDGANRKWIGTASSGAFLVSPDGTEVLEHFTSENSPLPNDKVMSIACNTNSNAVYFGTPDGFAEYSSDSAPAAADYSEVYAYPNPVRPDYTGWITITGLMDNSLVKITDAVGNVVYTATSNGGMVTWDGCRADGEPVTTGVYYVLASQNADSGSSGAVTKILVVR